MLQSLSIRNFALIDAIELTFDQGLTVITGETGSGKSILLGALNLLLGARADFSVIRDEESKTIVEGCWSLDGYGLEQFFLDNELDYEAQTIIRREVLPQGKSRAFVNDSPVSLQVLKELTDQLIQINSQHQTLQLKDKLFQLNLLDALADADVVAQDYRITYQEWKKCARSVNELDEQLKEARRQEDYRLFQMNELEQLQLDKIDYTQLQAELKRAEFSDAILLNCRESLHLLENENGIQISLKRIAQSLGKIAHVDARLTELAARVQSQLIESQDIIHELTDYVEGIEVNPKRLEQLSTQCDGYLRILSKHALENQEQLLNYAEALRQESDQLAEMEEELAQKRRTLAELESVLKNKSMALSQVRQQGADKAIESLLPLLSELKLPDAQLAFRLSPTEQLGPHGAEQIELMFTPNKGVSLQPIDKAASGGELSRFMLAVMTLWSEKKKMPTLIFDEIDTGVSGEVAERIGNLLRRMGKSRQLMAITHLPQVAAKGHDHFSVRKYEENGRTVTDVVRLNQMEREEEIASLMSGKERSASAIATAKELMKDHGN
jgi:DNA repair protein RecN (Recombination protein N)